MNRKIIFGSLGILAVTALYVVVPILTGGSDSGDYSAYTEDVTGDNWIGVGDARKFLESEGFRVRNINSSPLILKDVEPAGTFFIIVGMSKPYTPSEIDALDRFLKEGGSILLLDDQGYGAEFSSKYRIGFRTRQIFDDQFEHNQSFVRVNANLKLASYTVLLNGPVALADVDKNETELVPFMTTSNQSYIDLNANQIVDVQDKLGPFNVGIRTQVGTEGGRLVVIADSGWILNNMIDRGKYKDPVTQAETKGNKDFLVGLIREHFADSDTALDERLILFDESRRPAGGPDVLNKLEVGVFATERTLLVLLRSLPFTGFLLSLGFVLLAVASLVRLPGPESWFHRFLPNTFVPPPVAKTDREIFTEVCKLKASIDEGGGADVSDPLISQAVTNPEGVPDEEVVSVLRRLAKTMDLEVPDLDVKEGLPAATKAGASPKGAPGGGARTPSAS